MIDPNASDWSDLDLLTFTEVHERLAAEISALESELAQLNPVAPDASETDVRQARALQARIHALRERLAPPNK